MNSTESMPDSFSYQAMSGYGLDPMAGLQPAANIYQPERGPFVAPGLSYGTAPGHRFGLQPQGALDMHNPFVNVYHHPFQSVPLSAIQPFESCLPRSTDMYAGPTDCSQYMASPRTMALPPDMCRPGTSASQPQISTQAGVPSQWSGSMLSVSLEHPFDVHTFFANNDGTISNLLATPYTPSNLPSNERINHKRKSVDVPTSAYAGPSQREKRHCLGVRVRTADTFALIHPALTLLFRQVNTNLAPMLTPDSSPSSSHGGDGDQGSPLAEVVTPPQQTPIHLRPRKNVDYLPETPNTTSPTEARRAISAAARAQSITDHVMEIYRSYAKPKESPGGSKDKNLAELPFIEGYEPVLPAFPDLSGDEMMLSDEEDDQEKDLQEDPSPSGTSQRKCSKRSPRAARGQDKVSNRVAARRHREMTKERLKNVRIFRRCVPRL